MGEQIKQKLLSIRDLAFTAGPFVLLCMLLLGGAFWLIDPAPPKKITIATGPENGDYYALAKRYQTQLLKHHIRAELRVTQGSRENLALLLDSASKVDVAFMRSGTSVGEDLNTESLTSIGSLFFEPVWLFYRETVALQSLGALKGLRVELGAPGNGSAKITDALLRENGLARSDIKASQSDTTQAVIGLLDGQIDALVIVSAPESQMVQMLLRTPGIKLLPFPQAQAYSRKLGNLAAVALPRGMVDMAADIPPQDVPMVAPTATLVHNRQAHPATIDLLIQAAHAIHTEPSWFADGRKFPSLIDTELPISKDAARFYQSGPPFLQRYLPFWLANLVERMWVVLLSLGALLIPLSRILPPIYTWRIRSRIYRWYGQLRDVEKQTQVPQTERSARLEQDMFERLDEIEDKVNNLNVPLSHADEVYHLRSHIAMVRAKLKSKV
jgi:TRAP-type uncharacterized transport system substrate-binding protein